MTYPSAEPCHQTRTPPLDDSAKLLITLNDNVLSPRPSLYEISALDNYDMVKISQLQQALG